MNENLPEIKFKEKKEKKGLLPWLRARLGFGARSSMGGIEEAGGAFRGAANFGKLGGFGSSSGIGALFAGKAGLLITAAIVAVGTGVYLANNGPAPVQNSAFNSGKTPDNYVPSILRSQARNQGSSLDMFKDANKNSGITSEEEAARKAEEEAAAKAEADAAKGASADQSQNQPAPGNNMQQDMMGKLQGASMGSLTSSLGGGESKFSGMGGFGNKFGKGAVGPQVGLSSVGSGFQGMPKFDQRKKVLAMKGSSRPVFSSAKSGKGAKSGPGSYNQAKGIKATQKSYSGSNVDSARSTQDKAWEGSTAEGTTGGAGVGAGDGGAGVVTSPSLDNTSSSGGSSTAGTGDEPVVPDTTGKTDADKALTSMCNMAMMLILLSAVLSAIGGALVAAGEAAEAAFGSGSALITIGDILNVIAIILGVAAIALGVMIMTSKGQAMMGGIYIIGGGVAVMAGIAAFSGEALGVSALMWSAIAGIIGLLGAMAGGSIGK
ncbi:MAG: hypothetical protein NTX59_13915 [Elusimicrobia bacterium]|nr:hypothetical protein [Elusimicrobiota bacterium]